MTEDPSRAQARDETPPTARRIETGTDDLLARAEGGVLVLTLNRPERRNAFSRPMVTALGERLAEAEIDPEIRVIVVTGAGGAFCAGGDVKAMAEGAGGDLDLDARAHLQRLNQRATAGRLHEMPKPTIAALPGPAAGAGFSLALSCDLRIMAQSAFLTTAFARVGFSGDYGGTYFLSRLVGSARARELYYLSDRVTAQEALSLGLTNRVAPDAALEEETMALARRLAAGPPIAYRYMKENLNRAMTGGMGECLDLEVTHHVRTGQTEDHREAARAFVEKRAPAFRGK